MIKSLFFNPVWKIFRVFQITKSVGLYYGSTSSLYWCPSHSQAVYNTAIQTLTWVLYFFLPVLEAISLILQVDQKELIHFILYPYLPVHYVLMFFCFISRIGITKNPCSSCAWERLQGNCNPFVLVKLYLPSLWVQFCRWCWSESLTSQKYNFFFFLSILSFTNFFMAFRSTVKEETGKWRFKLKNHS